MANNVDININAKGAATASKGLRGVASAAKKLDSSLDGLSVAAKAVQASFAPLLAVVAAYKAVTAVSDLISSSNEAFLTQAEAARGATEAQKAFASELQRTLGIGDEVTLDVMQQAKALGIAEGQMQEATKAAIGISEATGEGISEALKKVNRALNGNADAFSESIPGLTEMATESDKLAAVNALVTRGLEKQAQKMEGLQGIQTRASNSLGDLMEVFGEILAPIRAVISQGVLVFSEVMQKALVPAVELANQAMKQMPVIFEFTKNVIVGGVAAVQTAFTNLPKIVEYASVRMQLGWTQMQENAKHAFTVVLPEYMKWFEENAPTILQNGANAASTIFHNYFERQKKLFLLGFEALLDSVEQFSSVDHPDQVEKMSSGALEAVTDMFGGMRKMFKLGWTAIKADIESGFLGSGKSLSSDLESVMDEAVKTLAKPRKASKNYAKEYMEIMSSDLLDGFKAEKLTSLPEIVERQITDKEKSLKAQAGKLGRDLANSFTGNFDNLMAGVSGPAAAIEATLKALGLKKDNASAEAGLAASVSTPGQLQAVQGRLLTRGPNSELANMNSTLQKQLVKLGLIAKNTDKKQEKKPTPEPIIVNKVGLL